MSGQSRRDFIRRRAVPALLYQLVDSGSGLRAAVAILFPARESAHIDHEVHVVRLADGQSGLQLQDLRLASLADFPQGWTRNRAAAGWIIRAPKTRCSPKPPM